MPADQSPAPGPVSPQKNVAPPSAAPGANPWGAAQGPGAPPAFVPAKTRLFAGLCLAGLVVIALFSALLWASLSAVHRADPAAYTPGPPPGFAYEVGCRAKNGLLAFEGWALVPDERFEAVDCRVALYQTQTGELLVLPSHMVVRPELTQRFGQVPDNYLLRMGGFAASVPRRRLAGGESSYEICLVYRANQYNNLVHTGHTVADALAAGAPFALGGEGGGL